MPSFWMNATWLLALVERGKLVTNGGAPCDPEQRFQSVKPWASLALGAKCHWKETELRTHTLDQRPSQFQQPSESLQIHSTDLGPVASWPRLISVSDILIDEKKNISLTNSPSYFPPQISPKITVQNSLPQKPRSKRNQKINEDDVFQVLCFNLSKNAGWQRNKH